MFFINGALPQMGLVTSKRKQKLGILKVKYIIDVNIITKDILRIITVIRFSTATSVFDIKVVSISHA